MAVVALLLQVLPFVVISVGLWKYLRDPLRSIPGPFLAKFSDAWRLYDVWRGQSDQTLRDLHRKHGDVVRIGPKCLSLADPAILKTVYSTRKDYIKSTFYHAGDPVDSSGKRIESGFSTRDESFNDYFNRPIKAQYSMTNTLKMENRVDATLDYFVQKLKREYVPENPGEALPCPIGKLLHFFAWDSMSEITFSKRFGALDEEPGVIDVIKGNESIIDYKGTIGQMPVLDPILRALNVSAGAEGFKGALNFAAKHLQERVASRGEEKQETSTDKDFVDVFIRAENNIDEGGEGKQITERQMGWLINNMVAGSDTTSLVMQAAVYVISRDESFKSRLVDELKQAFGNDKTQDPDFQTCQTLPYLDALMKETMRLYPPVGLPVEREVPETGLRMPDSTLIPGGTIVGMNARVLSHNEKAYGESADQFMPKRWLRDEKQETQSAFDARIAKMKQADFTFGAGRRSCIGRPLALVEIYKTIARLFLEFDVSCSTLFSFPGPDSSFADLNLEKIIPANPDSQWTVVNGWFVKQHGIDVCLRKRD